MAGCSFEAIVEEDLEEDTDETKKCAVCFKEATGAHRCKLCHKPVHLPCGEPVGDEGYGQKVVCFVCDKSKCFLFTLVRWG
ncbi:Hypothetical predicted protein [Paramuricea clavata]|uniref:SCAN domain-containing protein n=1 Tax=Paramuricea clavata TaxID=317549 RepID=A0A6S7J260_PARCT|nr:Hypothetical predicted protein [Paramuricea clavata]